MTSLRASLNELARLLNAVAEPVYVLDDQRRIVFCNAACLAWTGRTSEELLGRFCGYHSTAEATAAAALTAGLCPPPEALAGRDTTGLISYATPDGRLLNRPARFVPLGRDADPAAGVIVILDGEECGQAEAAARVAAASEAAQLHERIQRFRHEWRGRYHVERLVGDSPAMTQVRAQVLLAASSRCHVLIAGPKGSGRQHVAKAIHYSGDPKAIGSLAPLACTTLGAEVLQSAIAALAAKRAASDARRPGTLLLNDVDRLPSELQAALAEFLASPGCPLRVLATARVPLGVLARRNRYRRDLACQLGTLVIRVPALASRSEDVPLLAQLLVEDQNAASEKQLGGFSPEALDLLAAYPWPGNVDELAATIQEAHERAATHEIAAADLPRRIHLAADAAAHPRRAEKAIVLDDFLAQVERELVGRAMARAKGNKTKAAHLLGMTRPRLYRRLVQLGLEP
jgi:DNA-binding NtrC family response regulator